MKSEQVISVSKILLKYVVSLALLILLFRAAHFSLLQTIILTVLVAIGYETYTALNMKFRMRESFSPFRVIVQPKFDELLLDYKLLKDIQDINALHAMWKK